jgi:hypothetical protein
MSYGLNVYLFWAGSDFRAQGLYAHQLDHGIINLTPSSPVVSLPPFSANHINGGEARPLFVAPPALPLLTLSAYI